MEGIVKPTAEAVMMRTLSSQLAAIAQETRLNMMFALGFAQRLDVTTLAEMCGITPALCSSHLQVLKRCGLVWDFKEGKQVYYCVHPDVYGPATEVDEVFRWNLGALRVSGVRAVEDIAADPPEDKPEAPPKGKGGRRGKRAS